MISSAAILALKRIPLFSGMSFGDLRHVAKIARVHKVPKGVLVFEKNMAGNHLFVVIKGRIKIYSEIGDGRKKKTFAYLDHSDFFGEMSLLDKKGRSLSAAALGEAELLTISRKEFQKLLARNPGFALKVIKTLVERLRRANEEIEGFSFRSLYGRVCRKLLDLAEKPGGFKAKSGASSVLITHTELADLTGTAREMVTRVLSSLRRQGVIEYENHHIKVMAGPKLRELAQIEQ